MYHACNSIRDFRIFEKECTISILILDFLKKKKENLKIWNTNRI